MIKGNSILWLIEKEEIINIVEISNTIKEALEKLGEKDIGAKRQTFFRVCEYYKIDLTELRNKSKEYVKNRNKENILSRRNINEYLIENSSISRKNIKKYILSNNIKEYKCEKCGNTGNWNGDTLVLQLDHINGVNNDNRIENLRFLCPNCHSQTDTFANKRSMNKKSSEENKRIRKEEAIKNFKIKLNTISDIDLKSYGWIEKVSERWNISHTQVRRLFKKYGEEIETFER